MYMVSQSNNDGSYTLTVTFKPGRGPELCPGAGAEPHQPGPAAAAGGGDAGGRDHAQDATRTSSWSWPLLARPPLRPAYLSNYVTIKLKDEIARVDGVGDVSSSARRTTACASGSTRTSWPPSASRPSTWPTACARRTCSSPPGTSASRRQTGEPLEYTIDDARAGSRSRPSSTDIIIRTMPDGAVVRDQRRRPHRTRCPQPRSTSKLDGTPNASLAIWRCPTRMRIATAQNVRERMEQVCKEIPRGHRVRRFARHDAVHRGVNQGGDADADRGDRAGRAGGAGVLAELALGVDSAGGRAGRHHRHVRRHGGHRLFSSTT